MKVSTTLTIIFFLVALLGSIGGTSYHYTQSIASIEEQVYSQLAANAQSRAEYIGSLLNEQKEKIEIAATHQELSNEELKKIRDITNEFYEVFIINPNGKIIASSDESKIGIDRSNDSLFIFGRNGTYIKDAYTSDITGKNSIAISTSQGVGNVLVARIETTKFDKITTDRTGLGESGETYLINNEGYAITPLVSITDTFLKWKVESVGARTCLEDLNKYYFENEQILENHTEAAQIYLDYSGKKVIGTHSYVQSMKWCLITEIDEEEIIGKQKAVFQRVSLTIIITITILSTLIGLLIGRFIDRIVVFKKRKKSL